MIIPERRLSSVASRGVFVGRAGELAVLEAAAAAARRGEPQVVLVEGEAGVGKSSLLARFASGLAGAAVLRASGDEAELLLPYGVVGQLTTSARGGGLVPDDVVALGRALGAGELPRQAVSRLLEATGGNPLFCRAVLEEAVAGGTDLGGGELRVPRSVAGVVLSRVGGLSPAAQELVAAAAVLGHRCELAAAAALASLDDPLPALAEGLNAGILAGQSGGATAGMGFTQSESVEAAGWLAGLCMETGRVGEAIEWGERAAGADTAPARVRHAALGLLAIALFADGRGPEGLSRLAFLPAAPAEVPLGDTDPLVMRGLARLLAEDMTGAIADLSTAAARLRAGVPLATAGQCLSYLAGAECLLGSWDDAVVHAELAVSLAHAADRVWEFGFVHLIFGKLGIRSRMELITRIGAPAPGAGTNLGSLLGGDPGDTASSQWLARFVP